MVYFVTFGEGDTKADLRELASGGEVEITATSNQDRKPVVQWLADLNAAIEAGDAPGEVVPLNEFVEDTSTGKAGLKRIESTAGYQSITYLFSKDSLVFTVAGFFPTSADQGKLISEFEEMVRSFQP